MKLINIDSKILTPAREIYEELGIKKKFPDWIKYSIKRAMLEENKDFNTFLGESTGGRPSIEYYLTEYSAISIIAMSGGENAKEVRDKLVDLYKQHNTGKAWDNDQILALMDLSKAVTLISIQEAVERKHFNIYNNPTTWYERRAALLGYSKDTLIEAMCQVNKKYHSMRSALMQLDSSELIRTGVIDLMKCLGKTDEYAISVGNLCKDMAQRANFSNIIWDDTKENPLKLNESSINERKSLLDKSIKQLK